MSRAPMAATSLPADQPARDRILADLDTNLLVEAGAGSGKTTSLVGRMLRIVARGTPVEQIAAVTFTRKAANELRERFQLKLEEQIRAAAPGSEAAARYDAALRSLDRAFLGTIHSFCARLLRERPLEVLLDPNFQEVSEEDWDELTRSFWNRWLERVRRADDPALAGLRAVLIDPRMLFDGFRRVIGYPDVEWALADATLPNVSNCRAALEALLLRARTLMPRAEPADGWDGLMGLVRRLELHARLNDWRQAPAFCAAVESIAASHCKLVQKRWSDGKEGKLAAKELGQDFEALLGGEIAEVLRCWREHRYPVVMRFLLRAAADFARERHATGQLGFEDLLLLAAKLLREEPRVREELGARYAHLLVDEFQDTDPVQAEVCFLLASDPAQGDDWRAVTPRPGSLFVVGDPKQSIYRFRRADIQTYDFVKTRFAAFGDVLALTQNFRSVAPIEALVNDHFATVFPAEPTPEQAPFSAMRTTPTLRAGQALTADGVARYTVRTDDRKKSAIVEADAAALAAWIAGRVSRGERAPGDFLVLTDTKFPIEYYARALAAHNVPVTTTGAKLPQERELEELLVVLRALADPENAVLVAAALEGLFCGCSPADLFDARRGGLHFAVTHRPADAESLTGRALAQLHEWWTVAQRHPADVLVERILDDTGLLFHAASQTLGDARAGALLHLVEALRAGSATGGTALTDAMERIEVLLARDAADAPLRPGRVDTVRVMNLHKAKGLEAPVVVLAAPVDRDEHVPTVHVRRVGAERPTGGLVLLDDEKNPIAQPPRWAEMEAAEALFAAAERGRLLYVAVTRAMHELVVARCERVLKTKGPVLDHSAWSPLAPALDRIATTLELAPAPGPGRAVVQRTGPEMRDAVEAAAARLAAAATPAFRVETVTESVKGGARADARAHDLPAATSPGAAWGRAVHRSLEALGRGRDGEGLRAFVRAVAREEGLPDDRLASLERLLGEVRASAAWARLAAAGPFAVELPVMARSDGPAGALVTEGVIDAAALGPDGWLVVDWKTDAVEGAAWAKRRVQYEEQVAAYCRVLAELTGRPASGSVERVR